MRPADAVSPCASLSTEHLLDPSAARMTTPYLPADALGPGRIRAPSAIQPTLHAAGACEPPVHAGVEWNAPVSPGSWRERGSEAALRYARARARDRSLRIRCAASLPGAPMTQPPGCVPEPHW